MGNRSRRRVVRVPEMLKWEMEEIIGKNPTVRREYPFGHNVLVTIKIEYVPKSEPNLYLNAEIQRKRVGPSPKLVQSEEPFGEEHFEMLLQSPLRVVEKDFVRFFQKRENQPTSPAQWVREGFKESIHISKINSMCRRHRLGVALADTGEYDNQEKVPAKKRLKYKFYVMERADRARGE